MRKTHTALAEIVEAEELWDTPQGGIVFLNAVPEAPSEPVELCGKTAKNGKPCVRTPPGHGGPCLSSLKPKFVKPKMLKVRGFAPGSWEDFEIVKE